MAVFRVKSLLPNMGMYSQKIMKSQTLTTGSNIDHMIMSHDRSYNSSHDMSHERLYDRSYNSSHDMSHERLYDSHMIDHMAYYMICHMTIVGGEGQECNDFVQSFS
jgi:hypothetical protein